MVREKSDKIFKFGGGETKQSIEIVSFKMSLISGEQFCIGQKKLVPDLSHFFLKKNKKIAN